MTGKRRGNKLIALSTTLLLLLTMLPIISFAGMNDITGHWAEATIQEWLGKGFASGYPDNTFRPQAEITRAEFMTLVNKAFYFTQEAEIDFKDVSPSDWYYSAVGKAIAAGYIGGYPDGTMAPNNSITRQEAAIIIAKVKGLELNTQSLSAFSDAGTIAEWSKVYVGAVVKAGLMSGYPDGSFKPMSKINRAEAIVALNNTLAEAYLVYDKAGTFGPTSGMETIDNTVVVKADGVTLQNYHITGDLIIAEEVGTGDVTLNNLTVDGETYLRGGGTNSIHINGGKYKSVTVQKTSSGRVRVVATNIDGLKVVISSNASGQGIVLEGKFDSVQVDAPGIAISTQGETAIAEMNVSSAATNANIELGADTVVAKMKVNVEIKVTGKGVITNAEVTAENVIFETPPVEVVEKITPTTPDTPVTPVSPGGGGDDNDTPTATVDVTGVSVSPTTLALDVGGSTGTITATIAPSNATNKSVTWATSNASVATVSNGVVTPVAAGIANVTATSVANTTKSAVCVVTVSDPSVLDISGVTATKDTVTVTFNQNIVSITAPNTIEFASGTYYFDVYQNNTLTRFGHYGLISNTSNSMTFAILGSWGDLSTYDCDFVVYTGSYLSPTVVDQSGLFNFTSWADHNTDVSPFMYDTGEIWVTVEDTNTTTLLENLSASDLKLFTGDGTLVSTNFQVGSDYDAALPSSEFLLTPTSGTFEGVYKVRFAKTGYNPDNEMFTITAPAAVNATTPSAITLAVGSTNPVGGVTNVVIPNAGATDTTGAVTGWVTTTADKIKFTVTDGGSATSTILINGSPYTSGADYTVPSTSNLTIVVTTSETGKTTVVRTFTVTVAAAVPSGPASTPSSIVLAQGSSNPVGSVVNVAIPVAGGTDTTGQILDWSLINAESIKFTVTDSAPATSTITINATPYVSGADYVVTTSGSSITAVVTTSEAGKTTVVRTFVMSVTENAVQATSPSAIVLSVGGSNPVGGVTDVSMPLPGATDTTGTVFGWASGTADRIKFTVTDSGSASSMILINGMGYSSGADYTITSTATLTVEVYTVETGKATVTRTFTIAVNTP